MSTGRLGAGDTAIQPTIFDAKADILTATAADTPARLAVGNNGETLVADSSATTGLRYTGLFGANKNKILNGDFGINQRGFTSTTTNNAFGFDRWQLTAVDGTTTWTSESFTPGTAPVAGYEGNKFTRIVTTGQTLTTANSILSQKIEDVRTFANQTVTFSFWAKAASGTPKIAVELSQYFGSGGSPSSQVNNYLGQATLSTSWQRFSLTLAIPSISGKTIGTANDSSINLNLYVSRGSAGDARTGSLGIQSATFDIWGVQVESGSVATPFQTATGTLAGELAACQRYYQKSYNVDVAPATVSIVGAVRMNTQATNTSHFLPSVSLGNRMRTTPTVTVYSTGTGTSGQIANRTLSGDVGASLTSTGASGFTAYVTNSSISASSDLAYQWVAESEL